MNRSDYQSWKVPPSDAEWRQPAGTIVDSGKARNGPGGVVRQVVARFRRR